MTSRTLARRGEPGRLRVLDTSVGSLLGAGAFVLHLWSTTLLPETRHLPLFGSDTDRVARHMTVRGPMLDRSQFHLLFPLSGQTPTRVAMALGLDRLDAVQLTISMWGAVATVAFYLAGRRLGLTPFEAAGPAALTAVAGASIVFFAIPETYGVGAALVTVALIVIAGWRTRAPSVAGGSLALVLGGCITLPAVVMPAVALLRSDARWRRWIAVAAGAAVSLVLLLAIQRAVFGTQIDATVSGESEFLHSDVGRRALTSLRTVLLDAWVTPEPNLHRGVVTFWTSGWWSGGPLRLLAAALLVALWTAAARECWRRRGDVIVMSCTAAVAALVAVTSFYGDEPFLYSATLIPMVMAAVIAAVRPPVRRIVVALSWVLVPILAVVNLEHLQRAGTLIARSP